MEDHLSASPTRPMLHGCTIGERSLIGIQAVILNGARIGRDCLVGADALVTEGKTFPDNTLIIGSSARALCMLDEKDIADLRRIANSYAERSRKFKTQLKRIR